MRLDETKIIEQLIKIINNSWTDGDIEGLSDYFHKDMVITQPGQGILGAGKQACIESYRQFVNNARIKEYQESKFEINIWENTAVVSYKFDINYKMDNKDFVESGIDLFVFSKVENKWLAVWRTILPAPSEK